MTDGLTDGVLATETLDSRRRETKRHFEAQGFTHNGNGENPYVLLAGEGFDLAFTRGDTLVGWGRIRSFDYLQDVPTSLDERVSAIVEVDGKRYVEEFDNSHQGIAFVQGWKQRVEHVRPRTGYVWGVEENKTLAGMEKQIRDYLIDELDNRGLAFVYDASGNEYRIRVVVAMTITGERRPV